VIPSTPPVPEKIIPFSFIKGRHTDSHIKVVSTLDLSRNILLSLTVNSTNVRRNGSNEEGFEIVVEIGTFESAVCLTEAEMAEMLDAANDSTRASNRIDVEEVDTIAIQHILSTNAAIVGAIDPDLFETDDKAFKIVRTLQYNLKSYHNTMAKLFNKSSMPFVDHL
jgi:hypothetical protein